MNSAPKAGPSKIAARSDNFHLWRSRKDQLASKVIGLGGFVVIAAVLLILFYKNQQNHRWVRQHQLLLMHKI